VTHEHWARAYARIVGGREESCPSCGSLTLRYRLIGDPRTRLGFGLIWCDTCRHGDRLSRIQIALNLEMRALEDASALEGIPEIHFIGE
jgi:hypothetical protein